MLSSPLTHAGGPFLWGVSNASFQVEGSPLDSNWTRWTRKNGKIKDGTSADTATDFLNRYDEDFALAQAISLNSFRISIAWERVNPAPGVFDLVAIGRYRTMIRAMRARGLEPVVTLYHFVLPGWLDDEGGELSPRFVQSFADYSEVVVRELSDEVAHVKWWITINEPEVRVLGGYLGGGHPPGKNDPNAAIRVIARLAEAHIEGVRKIRALKKPELQVSIAKNWIHYEARHGDWFERTLSGAANQMYNVQVIKALKTGVLRFGFPRFEKTFKKVALPEGRSSLDFLGINYYMRQTMGVYRKFPFLSAPGPGPRTDLDWEIYPDGFLDALKQASKLSGVPILVTENGIADAADSRRIGYLESHLDRLHQAQAAGVKVLGYMHWSLTDNFEWAEGLKPRFGLVEIDYANGAKRMPRPSYYRYGEIVREASMAASKTP